MLFIEASAKTSAGVGQAFEELVQKVRGWIDTGYPDVLAFQEGFYYLTVYTHPPIKPTPNEPCNPLHVDVQIIDTPSVWKAAAPAQDRIRLEDRGDEEDEEGGACAYCSVL